MSTSTQEQGNGGRPLTSGENLRLVRRAILNASEGVLRKRFSQLAGLEYDSNRDVYKVAGYPSEYTFEEGWSRYRRQGLAKRIVDLPVGKTWRHKPKPTEGKDKQEDTGWVQTWNGLWDRLGLAHRFPQADRMASIGEYSVLLLGLTGVATDRDWREPAEELSGPDDVLYVKAYKQSDVSVKTFVEDGQDPRHGRPLIYEVDLGGGERRRSKAGKVQVHWSRVIHVVEDPLDSDVYGLPRLERSLNSLIDLEKICAATGEAFWQLAVRILQVSVDPDAAIDAADWDQLDEDLEDLVHDLRRHFMGQGIQMKYLGGDSPDPSGAADTLMMMAAADANIPKRILFGTETGERASQQDERAFLGSVGERIQQYAEPTILRGFTDRLLTLGVLEPPRDDVYGFKWRPLFELSEMQKAETAGAVAKAAKDLTPVGGRPRELATVDADGAARLLSDEELTAKADGQGAGIGGQGGEGQQGRGA